MYNVFCKLCLQIHCILKPKHLNIYMTLYPLSCTLHIIFKLKNIELFIIHYTLHTKHYILYNVHCTNSKFESVLFCLVSECQSSRECIVRKTLQCKV